MFFVRILLFPIAILVVWLSKPAGVRQAYAWIVVCVVVALWCWWDQQWLGMVTNGLIALPIWIHILNRAKQRRERERWERWHRASVD